MLRGVVVATVLGLAAAPAGEPPMRVCEPTAYKLRVEALGGGRLLAPVRPPTAVCEHGSMTFSVLVASG